MSASETLAKMTPVNALFLAPRKRRWPLVVEEYAERALEVSGVDDIVGPVVYGLTDLKTGEIRYVGCCKRGLCYRLIRHFNFARLGKTWQVSEWIRAVDYAVGVRILEIAPKAPREAELRWIHELLGGGFALTNYIGGPASAEHRAKIGEANRRRFQDPAEREKIAAANRGRAHSAETLAKMSASHRGFRHSEEAKAKMSAARKGVPKSPETRARMKEAQRRRQQGGG